MMLVKFHNHPDDPQLHIFCCTDREAAKLVAFLGFRLHLTTNPAWPNDLGMVRFILRTQRKEITHEAVRHPSEN